MTTQATAPTSDKPKSRIDQVMETLASKHADEYTRIAKLGNPADIMREMTALQERIRSEAKAEVDKEEAARKAEIEKHTQAIEAFKALAKDTLEKAWKDANLAQGFNAIPATVLKNVVFRVERNEDGKAGVPTVLVGEVGKARTVRTSSGNQGGARSVPLTVDGTAYESASAAKKALLPDKVDASMNRGSIVRALQNAGHTVTE